MTSPPAEQISKYLKSTYLCDSDSEEIKKKARELTRRIKAPKGAALKIFYSVRDEIPFCVNFAGGKASDTLRAGMGSPPQKANLQVALLRATGIPARYRRVSCRKELFKGIVSNPLYVVLPEVSPHAWSECYLSGKWISCEALLDKPLVDGITQAGLVSAGRIPTIDWDGASDLIIVKPWIVEDFASSSSLDDFLIEMEEKPPVPRFVQRLLIPLSNKHTDSLRKR